MLILHTAHIVACYHDGEKLKQEFLKNRHIFATMYPINMNQSAFERPLLSGSNAQKIIFIGYLVQKLFKFELGQ